MSEIKTLNELLNSPEWLEMLEDVEEAKASYEKSCDNFWNGLTYEEQLKVFYAVVKRIHKAEIVDQGTYRYALYDVFEFDPAAYSVGMDCGYMDLHNRIMSEEQYEEYYKKLRNKDGSIQY